MSEAEYRALVQKTFDRIAQSFESVDPDLADYEQAPGQVTITLADGSRCILSSQPSVRQVWLALASKGTAYHFDWQPGLNQWMDDKGRGVELVGFLRQFFLENLKLELSL